MKIHKWMHHKETINRKKENLLWLTQFLNHRPYFAMLRVNFCFMAIHCVLVGISSCKLKCGCIIKGGTEQNIYFIDLNSTVSRHTYFDITKDSY